MYRRKSVLDNAEQELTRRGYSVHRLNASTWDAESLHNAFAVGLAFPDYNGRNLDALHDGLRDVAHGDYGWSRDSTGLADTIDAFRAFAQREPDLATAVADALAGASRIGLLSVTA